jgi:hypothetical protein
MARKICILGSAESTRDEAPFADPSWEIWGLAWRFFDHRRMDACFEIHDEHQWSRYTKTELYSSWLSDPKDSEGNKVPVYLLPQVQTRYRKCKPYPEQEAEALMGRRYFTSSFSYMLALAIAQAPEEIAIYGVDLVVGEEYEYQRPAAEFLLGIAHAKGIRITIPATSSLLKSSFVYGVDELPAENPVILRYKAKAKDYREKIAELKAQIFTLEGAAHECDEFVTALMSKDRGLWGK